MFKNLLVPLDGSHLAEAVLPIAGSLADLVNASVTLIHIIERDAPREVHRDRHLTQPDEADAYLAEVRTQYFNSNTSVTLHVHTAEVSDVARSIVAHSEELEQDLVVMCTHGHGGLRNWFFGSIAQQVIAEGKTPVLLVPPRDQTFTTGFRAGELSRFLIPLDGNPEHELGLRIAIGLAQILQAEIHLLMVIPKFENLNWESAALGTMLPGSMSAVLDLAEQGGKEYLAEQLVRMQKENLLLTAEIERGDPAQEILKTAQRIDASLVILATHGKTGMDAFWSGSLTSKISAKFQIPLLLVPVNDSKLITPGN